MVTTRQGGERKERGRTGGDRNIDILQQRFPLRYNDILINLLTGRGRVSGQSCLWTTNVCPINTTPDATLATINVPIFNFAN